MQTLSNFVQISPQSLLMVNNANLQITSKPDKLCANNMQTFLVQVPRKLHRRRLHLHVVLEEAAAAERLENASGDRDSESRAESGPRRGPGPSLLLSLTPTAFQCLELEAFK